MSDDGFHVHGPHDHAVEHAGAHEEGHDDTFASRIAVMTAVLSTVGALFAYQGGATQNDAMLHKNSAAIKKTDAANRWNYYQSKSNKQNLAELASALTDGDRKSFYDKEVARYKDEKAKIKDEADKLEAEVLEFEAMSEASMHLHHRWAQATTLVQISIAMAAITLLTRRRWLNHATLVAAGGGLILGAMALAHV